MSIVTFDTLAAVRNLEKAGMGTPQAEAVAETIRVAVLQGVASKADIAELRTATQADIAELRSATQADIAELRTDFVELRSDFAELRAETQADIAALRVETKADIAGLKEDHAKLRAELGELRADLTWRMVLIMGSLLAIFTAVDRLFLS